VGELASIITAVATAVGTPGLTWLVMNKMQKIQISKIKELHDLQITHMQDSCKTCRKNMDDKIEDLDENVKAVETRQRELREVELPERYVRRKECENCQRGLKEQVEISHRRISEYHPKGGTGGS
jgi:hypothetical protein